MNEDLLNIQPRPIPHHQFAHWFQEVQYNDKTLSEEERKQFIDIMDETINEYTEGLPLMQQMLAVFNDENNDLHQTYQTILSVMLFVLLTQIDCMVACKYFILADKDYDRRYMRGKLKVLQNEGFKRLYGFEKTTYEKSEWNKLLPLMGRFPEIINRQYQDLTFQLQKLSESSTWWREERNIETHLDTIKLLESRQEDINESTVVMDSMKLYSSLMAVSEYLENLHTCLYNYLEDKYQKGELVIE